MFPEFGPVDQIVHKEIGLAFIVIQHSQSGPLAIPGQQGIIGVQLCFAGTYTQFQQYFTVHEILHEHHLVTALFEFHNGISETAG